MNSRAKFDTASFILGREIGNRTNTQKLQQKTNKQTVNDISTLRLSACVDNKPKQYRVRLKSSSKGTNIHVEQYSVIDLPCMTTLC